MSKFKLEDYRQPWETGPHWELKKEFIDEYSEMFSEDRLLCLAQAYSNIVLKCCSYPEPVMRQISLLSEPLQMRKRFQGNNSSEAEQKTKSQQKKSKSKIITETSEKSFKFIKFCTGEDESKLSVPDSCTVLPENGMKQILVSSIKSEPISDEEDIQDNKIFHERKIITEEDESKYSVPSSSSTSDNLSVSKQLVTDTNLKVNDLILVANVKSEVNDPILVSNVKSEPLSDEEVDIQNSRIVDNLSLAFIQSFVQKVRQYLSKNRSPMDSIVSASQSLQIWREVDCKVNRIFDKNLGSLQFYAELHIKGCTVASGQASHRKKAKQKCAEIALDVLTDIINQNEVGNNSKEVGFRKIIWLSPKDDVEPISEVCEVNSISKRSLKKAKKSKKKSKPIVKSENSDAVKSENSGAVKSENSDAVKSVNFGAVKSVKSENSDAVTNSVDVLQPFSDILAETENFTEFLRIAKNLNLHHSITFIINKQIAIISGYKPQKAYHHCKFFLKDILISTENDKQLGTAKKSAIKSGFEKLKKLSEYEIVDGVLMKIEKLNGSSHSSFSSGNPEISVVPCSFLSSDNPKISVVPCPSFILNHKMFDASIRDGFVLLNKLSLIKKSQMNKRTMLPTSASFCHKSYEYKFEDILEVNLPVKKLFLLIGEEVVSCVTAPTCELAKVKACDEAFEVLKKKYYTLKVKNEYDDGCIITRSQVFEEESFSSNALTKDNIGCKMLMKMGWTGGGLGTHGISEPVEVQGNNFFGRGLGYSKKGEGSNDLQKMRKKINSLIQEYSKTDTLSDLIFSIEFKREERKEIQRIAQRYGLLTASQNSNRQRYIAVRHKTTVPQILTYLAEHGGSNSKFELVDASEMSFEDLCNA